MTVRILKGDCRDVLRTLPDESVHCVVTSPPYWGLRDYGVAGQIGLEGSFEGYINTMRAVFDQVWRILRKDGTLWLNLGNSYTSTAQGTFNAPERIAGGLERESEGNQARARYRPVTGLKPKDLVGVPWRVALALQADGWYLRSDIIWSKPNPMPESVTDRPTKAHEYLFLMSKSERYYYDATAIAEPISREFWGESVGPEYMTAQDGRNDGGKRKGNGPMDGTRNRRSVWEIATSPFSEAHFATFPPALIEPCIKAGTSEKGCCAKCGKPWVRETEHSYLHINNTRPREHSSYVASAGVVANKVVRTTGWSPSCCCDAAMIPCTVLDPFGGAGTTGMVADRLGRNAILIELNLTYAEMAEKRLRNDAGMFAEIAAE